MKLKQNDSFVSYFVSFNNIYKTQISDVTEIRYNHLKDFHISCFFSFLLTMANLLMINRYRLITMLNIKKFNKV